MDLPDYINEWLLHHDRNPTWLARKAGWSHTYLLKLVNRKRKYSPSVEKLDSLARAMGVSVHTLVDICLMPGGTEEVQAKQTPVLPNDRVYA